MVGDPWTYEDRCLGLRRGLVPLDRATAQPQHRLQREPAVNRLHGYSVCERRTVSTQIVGLLDLPSRGGA